MNLNIIFVTAIICLQKECILADSEKSRACRSSRFRCQFQNKMRRLRDFGRTIDPSTRTIDPSTRFIVNDLHYVQLGTEQHDTSLQTKQPLPACQSGPDFETVKCPQYVDTDPLYCIEIHQLCDRSVDCPYGEDEDQTMCMFHRATQAQINGLEKSIIPLVRRLRTKQMEKTDYETF